MGTVKGVSQREFARRLTEAITRRKATNVELARATGLHKDTIGRYRRPGDKYGPPSQSVRQQLEAALRTPRGYLDSDVDWPDAGGLSGAIVRERPTGGLASGTAGLLPDGYDRVSYEAGFWAGVQQAETLLRVYRAATATGADAEASARDALARLDRQARRGPGEVLRRPAGER